jgi:SpoVK/Ycf46/Vps4 family AAA+-type ATPase
VLIVFSTNLEPRDLVDEAFLRRIRHKVEITDPTFEEFRDIFRLECDRHNIEFEEEVFAYLMREHYLKLDRPLRGCHPRDLLDEIVDIARYRSVPPALSKEMIDKACRAYFVEL